ncbi:MocR-like pyridoxine biosynthesis transcription factor PdxR [Dictyobacter kobayashii]|uniref:GntR family transcriptional regulator n=1 Tax=Dictyobacter kobayashii TaxID=2014872 RepID=A0A402ABA7_9CHLR|nr:PLP-dependent aminotransferase family protein [Dictyobacter kobayashii]GCE16326.1 GntR family transcriptional regulator [Dictyobacter kobayashii]
MEKNLFNAALLTIILDPGSAMPLYRQLYTAMRQTILAGTLPGGTKLPSTRAFAQTLGVSRATVIIAFEQLLYEGYIRGIVGSGTYVEHVLPDELLRLPNQQLSSEQTQKAQADTQLSARGKIIANSTVAPLHNWDDVLLHRAFRHGVPALHEFPFKLWSQLAAKRWRNVDPTSFGYTDPAGFRPLRREIAHYLQTARGVSCSEEQIIIVAGSQQAINLSAQLLSDPGDDVWIEDPCYLGARGALLSSGAHLVPVPIDAEGIDVAYGKAVSPQARMVYVTPSHQFPLGTTMSLLRRISLLHWAAHTGSWILEDDYDGEYRYAGHPLASLQSLDQADRVIYIGTFSKVLFPGLRIGYLVSPPALIDAFIAARAAADRHAHMLDQMVLTDFMAEEHFARHVRRMRALYEGRQATLVRAAQHSFLADILIVEPDEAGMHLLAKLPLTRRDTEITALAASAGIAVTPVSKYYMKHPPTNALMLGYAAFNEQEIHRGIQALAAVLHSTKNNDPAAALDNDSG